MEQLAFCQKIDNGKIVIKASLVGGEFSGNTALCLAYLALRNNKKAYIQLSGLNKILKVQKERRIMSCYVPVSNKTLKPDYIDNWHLVKLPGINHLIVPQFYQQNKQSLFKKAIEIINKNKQKLMSQKACGIIFVKEKNQLFFSKPFIYFKQSNLYQLLAETSCGSASIAMGLWQYLITNRKSKKIVISQASKNISCVSIRRECEQLFAELSTQVDLLYEGKLNQKK